MMAQNDLSNDTSSSDSSDNENEEPFNDQLVYVDLLCFKGTRGSFICKEFSIVDSRKNAFHTLVKSSISFHRLPPYYKRHANYDTKYVHGLSFKCGHISTSELVRTIIPKFRNKVILVEHDQKVTWLKHIFRHHHEELKCVTLNEMNYNDSFMKYSTSKICDYHNNLYGWKDGLCTLSTAHKLRKMSQRNELINWNK